MSTQSINPFTATGRAVTSIMNSLVKATGLVEKTLNLAENEIDALEQGQQIRLDEVRAEREQLKAARRAKTEELNK